MFGIKFYGMRGCIRIAQALRALADMVHSLPTSFMRPAELEKVNERYYASDDVVEGWDRNRACGLSDSEEEFLKRYGFPGAKALVVGCGAGRESCVLARRGLEVTAIDRSPKMIERASAASAGVHGLTYRLMSLGELGSLPGPFDLIFLDTSCGYIPTRRRRNVFLVSLKNLLGSRGRAMWTFVIYEPGRREGIFHAVRRVVSFLTFGNHGVEPGDRIFGEGEYHHCFSSVDEVTDEIKGAGLAVDRVSKAGVAVFFGNAEGA